MIIRHMDRAGVTVRSLSPPRLRRASALRHRNSGCLHRPPAHSARMQFRSQTRTAAMGDARGGEAVQSVAMATYRHWTPFTPHFTHVLSPCSPGDPPAGQHRPMPSQKHWSLITTAKPVNCLARPSIPPFPPHPPPESDSRHRTCSRRFAGANLRAWLASSRADIAPIRGGIISASRVERARVRCKK